ncbi:MAG: hypothetical protein SVV80_12785, partial [Planctomycetota bacterium]|nr:hypothetical protein [Planctomycetota bacterium]
MARPLSKIAPDWWDYTTLDKEILTDAAKLTADDMLAMSREGFKVVFYDTLAEFYLAEALEYTEAWRRATADNPVGICGPIGPTEQLPLVARLVNAMDLSLKNAHFWGMASSSRMRLKHNSMSALANDSGWSKGASDSPMTHSSM